MPLRIFPALTDYPVAAGGTLLQQLAERVQIEPFNFSPSARCSGYALLNQFFDDRALSPVGLAMAALPPTLIAAAIFRLV